MRHLQHVERGQEDQNYRNYRRYIESTMSLSEDAQAVQRDYERDLEARGEVDRDEDEMKNTLDFNKDVQWVQIAHEHQLHFQKVINRILFSYEQELREHALELAKETDLLSFQSNPEKPDEWVVTAKDSKNEAAKGLAETINQRKADFECDHVVEKIWFAKTDRELEIIAYSLHKKGLAKKINTEKGWRVEKTERRNSTILVQAINQALKELKKLEYDKALRKVKDAQTDRELEKIAYDLHQRGLVEKINKENDWHVRTVPSDHVLTGEPAFDLILDINGRHDELTGEYDRQIDEYEKQRREDEEQGNE